MREKEVVGWMEEANFAKEMVEGERREGGMLSTEPEFSVTANSRFSFAI